MRSSTAPGRRDSRSARAAKACRAATAATRDLEVAVGVVAQLGAPDQLGVLTLHPDPETTLIQIEIHHPPVPTQSRAVGDVAKQPSNPKIWRGRYQITRSLVYLANYPPVG